MSGSIVLVNPPFFDVQRPSIALGLLKAVLVRAGFSVTIEHANLRFAETVGLPAYQRVNESRAELALGDWVFRAAAFPTKPDDPDDYLDALELAQNTPIGPEGRAALLDLRMRAVEYLDELVEHILSLEPRIVGCTSTFCQHVASLAILHRVRSLRPDVVTMLGGANCESTMGLTTHRNFEWVDYVVSGEAEDLIAPLCRAVLDHGREVPPDLLPHGVLAPAHRQSGYPAIPAGSSGPRAVVSDMNSLPAPDYDDYFAALARSKYSAHITPNLPLESSRGCWWGQVSHCTFCGLNGSGMAFRSKRADLVLEQLDALVEKYGVRRIEMVDNILDHRYFESLLPRIAASERRCSIFYEVKSNLNRMHVELLHKAGVRAIQPGIESLDTRVLKLMRKGVSGWQNIRLLKFARQQGISVQWATIYGFPGEEDSWYLQMCEVLPVLFHLQPGVCNALRYDRFSPYHSSPGSFGVDLAPYRFYDHVLPLDAEDLAAQAYFFVDRNRVPDRSAHDLVAQRPGVRKYTALCRDWLAIWTSTPRPICTLFERNGREVLFDTRPGFGTTVRPLSPLATCILRVADDSVPANKLLDLVQQSGTYAPGEIEQEVKELTGAGLLLIMDGRALSLPLRAPVRPINPYALPFGRVSIPKKADAPRPEAENLLEAQVG